MFLINLFSHKNLQLKRRNTHHGAKLATVQHEYDHKRQSFRFDGKRPGTRRKASANNSLPSEGVTSLMISCQQELEHDIHTILLKKVGKYLSL